MADLSNETAVRLSQIPGIVGIKDATGDIGRGISLIGAVPEAFSVYSGDDVSAVALMLMGGKGNISVTANVAPGAMHKLAQAAQEMRHSRANGTCVPCRYINVCSLKRIRSRSSGR